MIITPNYILHNGIFYSLSELTHYGVQGMKWGVRRYQNEDGTLTAEGEKRLKLGGYAGEDDDPMNYRNTKYGRNAYDYAKRWEKDYGYIPINRLRFDTGYEDLRDRGREYVSDDYDWNRTSMDSIYDSYREYRDSEEWN